MADPTRVAMALAAIDAANAEDPTQLMVRGRARPKALGEAELASLWVEHLTAESGGPSPALALATRAHHIRRWEVPRSTYPEGRAGYLRWKNDLHRRHAEDVAAILDDHGIDEGTVARVQEIVRKRGLAQGDPEVQVLEDALCLVFLETQFDELASRTDDEVMVNVLVKSLAKMSDAGKAAALTLTYTERENALLQRALAGDNL